MPALDHALLQILQWLWTAPLDEPVVERRARELLLDTVGCAIAGAAEPEVAALFRHAAAADPGPVWFPGVPHGLSAGAFAAGFGAAACWHEACEGLAVAHGRPGLHAIPAVLGPALSRGVTLGELLAAVVVGYEIGGRLGTLCRIRPGMHVDGTWGSFGAAAAACRMAATSPEVALAALNHVACHMPFSLYWPIAHGSTARNAYPGHGAAHGAAAAVASQAGLGGPPGSIAEMLRLALGTEAPAGCPVPGRWLLLEGYLKSYPAVRHVHYGAAAAEAWHGTQAVPPDTIQSITLHTYEEAITYCGNRAPDTPIQAQFSLSYGVARSLAHGRLGPAAYAGKSLADPVVRRLEAMVALRPDPRLAAPGRRGCTLEVRTEAGSWRRTVDEVPGDPGRPMTRGEVVAKFCTYAAPVIGGPHADAILHRLLDGPLDAPTSLRA